jgi:signal transduction histidine kinase
MKIHGNEHVIIEIEDNVPGISSDVMPKIFDPYFTTKPKGEGTGLGLSISKKIIEQNQGTITVESEPGKTVFRVIVPIDVKLTDAQN